MVKMTLAEYVGVCGMVMDFIEKHNISELDARHYNIIVHDLNGNGSVDVDIDYCALLK